MKMREAAFQGKKHVVRTMWDIDSETTQELMDDMGVSVLQQDHIREDHCDRILNKPTPRPITLQTYSIPNAPKVSVLPVQYIENYTGTRHHTVYHLNSQYNEWNCLSDEMILCIFTWLPKNTLVKCARVCRRWNRLALDESLWRRIDLANKTLKAGVVGRVLDRGVAVLRLAKSEIQTPIYSAPEVETIIRMSKVQYLDLSMSSCSVLALEQILSTCFNLRKLSIENCKVNNNICKYIGQNKEMISLNMCMCQGITENGLVPICNNLQRLEALNVGWTKMKRGAVVYLIICLPPCLLKLNLSGCRETLLDEDVLQLCRSCSHMKELDLSDATLLTSAAVESVATMMRGLEYIAFSRCYHIVPGQLLVLGNILTLLAIDVFGMLKESALLQLRDALPNIEINKFPFSSIARPTTGIRRTSIWGLRVRDVAVHV